MACDLMALLFRKCAEGRGLGTLAVAPHPCLLLAPMPSLSFVSLLRTEQRPRERAGLGWAKEQLLREEKESRLLSEGLKRAEVAQMLPLFKETVIKGGGDISLKSVTYFLLISCQRKSGGSP